MAQPRDSRFERVEKNGDIGNDGVWDIWKLEGPAFSWYFRGSPHVHTWLNIARRA